MAKTPLSVHAWMLNSSNLKSCLRSMSLPYGAGKFSHELVDMLNKPQLHMIPRTFNRADFLNLVVDNLPRMKPTRAVNGIGKLISCRLEPPAQVEPPSSRELFLCGVSGAFSYQELASKWFSDRNDLAVLILTGIHRFSTSYDDRLFSRNTILRGGVVPTQNTDWLGLLMLKHCPKLVKVSYAKYAARYGAFTTATATVKEILKRSRELAATAAMEVLAEGNATRNQFANDIYELALESLSSPVELSSCASPVERGSASLRQCAAAYTLYKAGKLENDRLRAFRDKLANTQVTQVHEQARKEALDALYGLELLGGRIHATNMTVPEFFNI